MTKPTFNPPHMELTFDPDTSPARPWRTRGEHSYRDENFFVSVPSNFSTDLASVPALLTWLYDPRGRHQRAAIFHDWLYFSKSRSRFTADAIFRIIMQQDGVPRWRSYTIYLAVRLFGWKAWKGTK